MKQIKNSLIKFGDMIVISLCWLLCSLPVITVGAASTALCAAAFSLREEERQPAKVFFSAFGKKFKMATAVWLILLAVVAAVYLAVQILSRIGFPLVVMLAIGTATAALLYVWWIGMCLFPVAGYFDTAAKKTVRNAAFIAIHHRKQSVGCAFLAAVPLILFLILPKAFFVTAAFWLLIFPGVAAYIEACCYAPIFMGYEERRKEIRQEEKQLSQD